MVRFLMHAERASRRTSPRRSRSRRKPNAQLGLGLGRRLRKDGKPDRRGGPREGAGRKPTGDRAGVSHRTRPALASRFPVHVTLKLVRGLLGRNGLRKRRYGRLISRAFFMGCSRFGFRIIEFSIQGTHLHLICEAKDAQALTLGIQGLSIRIAKGLNRALERKGTVFADRYHARILRTPLEVRRALLYVLNNHLRHQIDRRRLRSPLTGVRSADRYSSGPVFSGWKVKPLNAVPQTDMVAEPRTWLLRVGWRRHGLLRLDELPGP